MNLAHITFFGLSICALCKVQYVNFVKLSAAFEVKPELQIIISFNRPEKAQQLYRERWQIETAFKALKSSGFNIEDTHLTDIKRIERLFALVMVAFIWAYLVGIFRDEKVKPINILKHDDRAKSIIKYGLEYIARILSNPFAKSEFDICKFLSYS